MRTALSSALRCISSVLDLLISPPFCESCSVFLSANTVLCEQCRTAIRPIVSLSLPITRNFSVNVFALGAYQGVLKRLILAKHHGNMVVSRQLGELLASHPALPKMSCQVLVPIPLHWSRQMRRGYNQSAEMCQVLAGKTDSVVVPILRRRRATRFQASLRAAERIDNVRNVFALKNQYATMVENKHVVLVDDLLTTGATMKEAVAVVRTARPASITVLVSARAQ